MLMMLACAADAHDAGPVLRFVQRGLQLMLMMLARFARFRRTGPAANAYDAGRVMRFAQRGLQLMLMMLARFWGAGNRKCN